MRIKHFNLPIGAQIFKAFSDEARIRILSLIMENGQMCTADLEVILGFSQTKTSRHLTYLKNAGLAFPRKVDQWVFYSIPDEVVAVVNSLLKYLEKDNQLVTDKQTYNIMLSNRELAVNKISPRKWAGKIND